MKVLVFGATGLTGAALTEGLLHDSATTEVVIFVRRTTHIRHPKLSEIIVDFDHLEQHAAAIQGDVVFNCLGTTLAKAGSQQAQQTIDRDYPIAIARLAAKNKVALMISVSSVGTTPKGNFYLKTKAEMEAGITAALGADRCVFMRPSFLVGHRKELRIGERIGLYAMRVIDHILVGSSSKYHSIKIEDLAKAMISIAKGAKSSPTPEYDEIMQLINR